MADLEKKNEEELKKLEDRIEDATQNLGETDISDALIAKALYLSQVGDKVRKDAVHEILAGILTRRVRRVFTLPIGKGPDRVPSRIRQDIAFGIAYRYGVCYNAYRVLFPG